MIIDRTPIHEGEALNGYFLRSAQANAHLGLSGLLGMSRVSHRVAYPHDQLRRLADQLGWELSALCKANPAFGHEDPRLNARFMPGRRQAFCPHCLADDRAQGAEGADGLMRLAWNNVFVTACTRHRVRLVDHCSQCEAPVSYLRTRLQACDCGQELHRIPAEAAGAFELAIAAKLTGEHLPECDLLPAGLREQAPDGLDRFLWFMHCHADRSGRVKVMKRAGVMNTAQAVAVLTATIEPLLTDWPRGFARFLEVIERAEDHNSAGLSKQLGSWYRRFVGEFNGPAYQWIHDEFAAHVSRHFAVTLNARTRHIPSGLIQIQGWTSVGEAARGLGVRAERVRAALDAGRITGTVRTAGESRDHCFVRTDEVERIRQARARHVTAQQVCLTLGVTRAQLDRLVQAGGFKKYAPDERPALVDDPFLLDEVAGFEQAVVGRLLPVDLPPNRQRRLADFAVTRSMRADEVHEVYQAIVRGDLRPRGLADQRPGLGCLVFDGDEVRALCAREAQDGLTLTLSQACEMTGWKPEVVTQWVKAGLLPARWVANGASRTTLIRVEDLVRFQCTHLVLSDVAAASGKLSRYLHEGLKAMGCPARSFKNAAGASFGLVVPYADLGPGLLTCRSGGLRADSDTEKSSPGAD